MTVVGGAGETLVRLVLAGNLQCASLLIESTTPRVPEDRHLESGVPQNVRAKCSPLDVLHTREEVLRTGSSVPPMGVTPWGTGRDCCAGTGIVPVHVPAYPHPGVI